MKRVFVFAISLFFLVGGVSSAARGILDIYVETGLKSNLALKQQGFSLKKSMQALKEARGFFLPSVTLEARFSVAGGGRVIDLPIGDLLNPIHKTLNQLQSQQVFSGDIPNQSIPFLREMEQDTRLRITQPLYQPSIYYNLKIKKALLSVEDAKLKAFKRKLILEIKTSYYNYLKTLKVRSLLADTRELLIENVSFCTSLFNNHKVTGEVVLTARAELSQLEQQLEEAKKNKRLAASYFNFLLNRPLDAPIQSMEVEENPGPINGDLDSLVQSAIEHREEFRQVLGAIAVSHHGAGLSGSGMLPTLTAVFDYGIQGVTYRFNGQDDYWMGSLILSWNIFRGGSDRAQKMQALLEKKRLEAGKMELVNHVRLQVEEVYGNLEVALKGILSTRDTLVAREGAFQIVSKKYKQGMVPQIEFIRTRNDFTGAGINHIIALYDYYIFEAGLEQAAARYLFDNN